MKLNNLGRLLLISTMFLFVLFVQAAPPAATDYSGYIKFDGMIPPSGTSAYIKDVAGNVVGNDTSGTSATGYYLISVNWDDTETGGVDEGVVAGDTIRFFFGDIQYYSQVVNSSGSSLEINFTTILDNSSPSAPTNVLASEINLSNQSIVNISWTTSTDNVWTNLSYIVFRSTSTGVNLTDNYVGTKYYDGSGTAFLNETLPSTGLTYYYAVYANDSSGNLGSIATENTVVVSNLVPAQVTGLSASTSNETINLTWSAVTLHNNSAPIGSDLSGYNVYTNFSGSWALLFTTSELSYENNTLTNGANYTFKVAAYDASGYEGFNSTTVDASPSERPSITIVPVTNSRIKPTVQINMSISSGQTLDSVSYFLYNSSGVQIENQTNTSVGGNSWSYNITPNLWIENDMHSLVVRANDTAGQNNSLNYNFMLDNTNPVTKDSDSDDSDNKVKNTDTITISVNATDLNTVSSVLVNGTVLSQSGDIWSVSTTTSSAFGCTGDRTCVLTFIATDLAGNINNSETLTLTVDDLAPSVLASNTNDSDNKVISSNLLNFTVNATDTNTVSSVIMNGTNLIEGPSGVWSSVNTTAQFGCTGDRACVLTFVATHEVGNINNSHTLTVTVDDTAPVASSGNTNDTDNYVTSIDSLNITVNVTDTNTISSVIVNGTSMTQSGDIWSTVNTTTQFGCTGDRTCVLTFVATDELGNIDNTHTLTITVDDVNPLVSDSNTDDSDNIVKKTDSLNITVNVTDSNINTVVVNGTSMTQSGDIWSTINTTTQFCPSVTDGSCVLTFVATDVVGNINNSHTLTITVDSLSPIAHYSNSDDSDNKVKSSDTINITINATDTNTVSSVLVNGTSMTQSGDIWSTVNTTSQFGCTGDRSCVLTFIVTDAAGNINNSETLTLTIDDVVPSVFGSNSNDSDNKILSTDSLNITVNVTDTNTVSSVILNGTTLVEGQNNVWSTVNSTSQFGCTGDRSCVLTFVATDELGNVNNSHTLTLTIDDVNPVVSASNTDDSDNYVLSTDSLNITVNVTDTNTVSSVILNGTTLVEGQNNVWSTVNSTSQFGCTGDRSCVLTFVATDELGNVNNSHTLTITVDDINPSVNSVSLSDYYLMPGQIVEVTVNVTDTYVLSVTANGNSLTNLTTATELWAANITMPLVTGYVTVVATDNAGNINTTNTTGFIVDSVAPIFSYTLPVSNGVYSNADGNITFNFSVSDQNLSTVNVSIDSGLNTNGSTENGTNIWIFSGLEAGLHTVTFTAQDEPGWNTSETFNFTIYRPVNITKYREDLTSELGTPVLRINITANFTDLNNNDTAEVNQTLSLDIGLNVTGTNVTARIPNFNGLRARWEHKFSVETNESSTKGSTASSKSGSTIQKVVIFENATNFLGEADFGMATITFYTILGNLDVFFIEDNLGNTLFKLSECSSVPTSVATSAAACYLNTSTNVTLYLPHFSGGGLGNDTTAPLVNISYPVNDTTLTNSYFNLNFTVYEANPNTNNFCNYTLINGGTIHKIDTAIAYTEFTNDGSTEYTYSVALQNISDNLYNLTVSCMDANNKNSTVIYNLTVLDATNPTVSSYTPLTDVTTTETSATVALSATTSEFTLCKYSVSNSSFVSMTDYLGSNSIYGLTHSTDLSYTSDDASEIYYVVCQDVAGRNSTSQQISYAVDVGTESSTSSSSSTSTRTDDDTVVESTKTVLSMSFGQIIPGDKVNYELSSINIPIKVINFESLSEIKFMTMVVSAYENMPSDVSELMNSYKYLEITSSGFTQADVKNGKIAITFLVDKEWVENNAKDTNSIYMYRFVGGEWVKLETEFVKLNGENYEFIAYTPGFSYFSIAADEKVIIPEAVVEEPEPEVINEPSKEEFVVKESIKKPMWPALIMFFTLVGAAILLFYHPKKKKQDLNKIKKKLDKIDTNSKKS